MHMRINSVMAAVLMASLFTTEVDLRCVNWIKLKGSQQQDALVHFWAKLS